MHYANSVSSWYNVLNTCSFCSKERECCMNASILGRGINQETEQEEIVTIGDIERRGGLLLRGNPRTGKTTLLVNLIWQDILHGHGLMFIDPHGDAIDD